MLGKKEIDNAFEAFYADDSMWYEISNLCFEDLNKLDKQYLFDKVQQICTEKVMPLELLDFLRWAITEQLNVAGDAIDKYGLLVMTSQHAAEPELACEIAKLYYKETYAGEGGEPFHNPENVKKWISTAIDLANSPVEYIHIIETVAEQYGGLHLGDKKWGRELLAQAKTKVDDKTYKKIEKSTSSLLS